jgi:hypothetical protein
MYDFKLHAEYPAINLSAQTSPSELCGMTQYLSSPEYQIDEPPSSCLHVKEYLKIEIGSVHEPEIMKSYATSYIVVSGMQPTAWHIRLHYFTDPIWNFKYSRTNKGGLSISKRPSIHLNRIILMYMS